MKRAFATLSLLFCCLDLFGQKQYTLAECYQLALENNLALQRAQNEIEMNAIDRQTAHYKLLPSLAYGMNHYFSYGKNIDPVTNNFAFEQFSGGQAALSLELELFSGFRNLYAIRQSGYHLQASAYAKKRTELELLSRITQIYARILLAEGQADAGRNTIQTIENELEIISEKIKVGRLTKYEYYTFDARLNSEKAELISVQNDSSTAVQELKELLNLSYKEALTIAPVDTSVLSEIYDTYITADAYIDLLLQQHPAILQAEMNARAADLDVKMAKSSLFPSIAIGGDLASNYNINSEFEDGEIPLNRQLTDNLGQNIGISLRIPVFSQKEHSNSVRKEKINVENAQLAIKEAENTVITHTLQLVNEFNAAKYKYRATLSAWEQNKLSYSLHEEKYRLGQISSVELLTARDILNASVSKYLQAKLELYFRYQLLLLLRDYPG